MEIRGEDFIKKVQLKQEKEEIKQRLNEINDSESSFSDQNVPPQLDREIQIQEEQEYSDIMLGKNSNEEKNKKKYLILGLILIILFLLTIIIIRLLTNDSQKKDTFSKPQESTTQKIVDNDNIEEQYQKIINEKLKNIKEENEKQAPSTQTDEKLNLEKIEKKEKTIETPVKKVEETKPNVFEVKKPKPVVKPKPKPIVKKAVKKVVKPSKAITSNKPSGTYVQIGAFSKVPSNKYLNELRKKGFKYKVYKVSINNKMFHKILIGPYNSRNQAKLAIENIKEKLKISGAFILKF